MVVHKKAFVAVNEDAGTDALRVTTVTQIASCT